MPRRKEVQQFRKRVDVIPSFYISLSSQLLHQLLKEYYETSAN
jgi:hypothetical protein